MGCGHRHAKAPHPWEKQPAIGCIRLNDTAGWQQASVCNACASAGVLKQGCMCFCSSAASKQMLKLGCQPGHLCCFNTQATCLLSCRVSQMLETDITQQSHRHTACVRDVSQAIKNVCKNSCSVRQVAWVGAWSVNPGNGTEQVACNQPHTGCKNQQL